MANLKFTQIFAIVCLGGFSVFGWAPLGWWPVLLLAIGGMYWLTSFDFSPLTAGLLGLLFGLAMHVGVYGYLYLTLVDHIGVSNWAAFLYTSLVLFALSLFTAVPCFFYKIIFKNSLKSSASPWLQGFVFSSLLLIGEYLRAVVFARMSLQSIGYTLIDTWWGGFAPVLGVYGLGWVGVMTAVLLVNAVVMPKRSGFDVMKITLFTLLVALFGLALKEVHWTEAGKASMRFRLIQSHVVQTSGLNSELIDKEAWRLVDQLTSGDSADITITSETAFPMYWSDMPTRLIERIKNYADRSEGYFLMGVATMNAQFRGGNSMVLVKPNVQTIDQYNKIHLFPFGEYSPWGLSWLAKKFPSPRNDLDAGALDQKPFVVAKGDAILKIGTVLCNEILLSDVSRKWAPDVDILVNPTNTSWFSKDVVIPQVLQIARMRALEVGRPVLHISNSGGTSVISANGQVIQSLGLDDMGALLASVQGVHGLTPYVVLGDWPILLLCIAGVVWGVLASHRRR